MEETEVVTFGMGSRPARQNEDDFNLLSFDGRRLIF